eukprot:GGOE01011358.1.p1 GENE.GGOE01011358.1~~GGOE01011358.1.p1  ORF type:complete len:115 (+),score=0.47 GGOE01011358.1:334-678(+)
MAAELLRSQNWSVGKKEDREAAASEAERQVQLQRPPKPVNLSLQPERTSEGDCEGTKRKMSQRGGGMATGQQKKGRVCASGPNWKGNKMKAKGYHHDDRTHPRHVNSAVPAING